MGSTTKYTHPTESGNCANGSISALCVNYFRLSPTNSFEICQLFTFIGRSYRGLSMRRYVDAMYLHCALGHCHVQIVEHLIGVLLLAVRLEGVPHRDGCLCVARPRSGCTPHGHRLRLCAAIVVCGGRHHGICGDAAKYKKRQSETKLAGSNC